MEDGKGIFFNDTWHKVSRHTTANAFRILEDSDKREPLLIANNIAIENFKSLYSRDILSESANKSMKVPYATASILREVLKPFEDNNNKLVRAALKNDQAVISSMFNDFKSNLSLIFDEDWSLSPSFKDFSKVEAIKLSDDVLLFM